MPIMQLSLFRVYPFQWSELEEMNTDDVEEEFKTRLANIVINKCCCLVYTVSIHYWTINLQLFVCLSFNNFYLVYQS